jgi:hypothetical protein
VIQELREVGVVGVAGAAEVKAFEALEVLLEAWDERGVPHLFQIELRDVFKWDPNELSAHQSVQVVEGWRLRFDAEDRKVSLEGLRRDRHRNFLQPAEYIDQPPIGRLWHDEQGRKMQYTIHGELAQVANLTFS